MASIEESERAINSNAAKQGSGKQSDSVPAQADGAAADSGVNENVTAQFPGSTVQIGGTKRGENPTIPVEEGGDEPNKTTGRATKANDFEGEGGPEDKVKLKEAQQPGEQDVTGNVR